MSVSREDKVKNIIEIAGISREEAQVYLDMYGENLDAAINSALEDINNGLKVDPSKHKPLLPGMADLHSGIEANLGGMHDVEFDAETEMLEGMGGAGPAHLEEFGMVAGSNVLPVRQRPMMLDDGATDSGTAFVQFAMRGKSRPVLKVLFIQKGLRDLMSKTDFSDKPLFIYVHKADHPSSETVVGSLFEDPDFAKMVNDCFYPVGLLASSREMRIVLNFVPAKNAPCILILRMSVNEKGGKEVRADDVILLANFQGAAGIVKVHEDVMGYLKKRNEAGAKFVYPAPQQTKINNQRRAEESRR